MTNWADEESPALCVNKGLVREYIVMSTQTPFDLIAFSFAQFGVTVDVEAARFEIICSAESNALIFKLDCIGIGFVMVGGDQTDITFVDNLEMLDQLASDFAELAVGKAIPFMDHELGMHRDITNGDRIIRELEEG